ncbi:hypothetical protein L0F63_007474 [Massospora cicadina]|nr:hypothetical protein L0F63_007474 [Massospora cicadina]
MKCTLEFYCAIVLLASTAVGAPTYTVKANPEANQDSFGTVGTARHKCKLPLALKSTHPLTSKSASEGKESKAGIQNIGTETSQLDGSAENSQLNGSDHGVSKAKVGDSTDKAISSKVGADGSKAQGKYGASSEMMGSAQTNPQELSNNLTGVKSSKERGLDSKLLGGNVVDSSPKSEAGIKESTKANSDEAPKTSAYVSKSQDSEDSGIDSSQHSKKAMLMKEHNQNYKNEVKTTTNDTLIDKSFDKEKVSKEGYAEEKKGLTKSSKLGSEAITNSKTQPDDGSDVGSKTKTVEITKIDIYNDVNSDISTSNTKSTTNSGTDDSHGKLEVGSTRPAPLPTCGTDSGKGGIKLGIAGKVHFGGVEFLKINGGARLFGNEGLAKLYGKTGVMDNKLMRLNGGATLLGNDGLASGCADGGGATAGVLHDGDMAKGSVNAGILGNTFANRIDGKVLADKGGLAKLGMKTKVGDTHSKMDATILDKGKLIDINSQII